MIKNLKQLRNRDGISQKQLAEALFVSQQSVNKYENHAIEPDIKTLIAIADYFHVTVDYLIGRTEEKNSKEAENAYFSDLFARLTPKEKACVALIMEAFHHAE